MWRDLPASAVGQVSADFTDFADFQKNLCNLRNLRMDICSFPLKTVEPSFRDH